MHAGRRVAVAQQQGHDVVVPIVPGLGDEAQVWGVGSAVGIAGTLLIGVRPWERVAEPACPGEVFSILSRAVLNLLLMQHEAW